MIGQIGQQPRRKIIYSLRTRLTLQVPQIFVDEIGGENVTFQVGDNLWGALIPYKGIQQFYAQQFQESINFLIVVRWRPDISAAMRFTTANRTFLIHAVFDQDAKQHFLHCLCEELKP